ncbi:MAG: NUDIX hydrolase [Thermotoga sp.]|mgnify:CR=1 FL=1|nr:NUDIX hydrolase [Thermotogota bacterium]RKX53383.1 MAG: NUDIX hydrolase [Thermotoga sp.]
MDFKEKTIRSEYIYKGKIVNLRVDEVELPNGKISTREIVEHGGAVGIVVLFDRKEVLLEKQFRKPLEDELLEIPAGKLENGESPSSGAERELLEETGLTNGKWVKLGGFYSSPGFTNEYLHIFLCEDPDNGEPAPDEDEFIRLVRIKLEDLMSMIFNEEVRDAKTVAGLLMALSYISSKES